MLAVLVLAPRAGLGSAGPAIRSSGSCVAPCTAHFEATEPVSWSGCAFGSERAATCPISSPGEEVLATATTVSGETASISAHGLPADVEGWTLSLVAYYSTPSGSAALLGYVTLGAGQVADIRLSRLVAGNTHDMAQRHNALHLTPGILPPLYDPDCVPGPVRAADLQPVARTGTWSWDGSLLRVVVPSLEAGEDYSIEWAPEIGSQVRSWILRRVINVGTGQWSGDPYGYGFLAPAVPPRAPTVSQFAPYYASGGATHEPGVWVDVSPEYSDAFPAGGFFPEVPGFFAPPLPLGYYQDGGGPQTWTRTLLVQDAQSTYGAHSMVLADPELPAGLMAWHGGHDFSDDGCFAWAQDGGHVLTILATIEDGIVTSMVVIETGIGGVYKLGRLHALRYPVADDLIFRDGF